MENQIKHLKYCVRDAQIELDKCLTELLDLATYWELEDDLKEKILHITNSTHDAQEHINDSIGKIDNLKEKLPF